MKSYVVLYLCVIKLIDWSLALTLAVFELYRDDVWLEGFRRSIRFLYICVIFNLHFLWTYSTCVWCIDIENKIIIKLSILFLSLNFLFWFWNCSGSVVYLFILLVLLVHLLYIVECSNHSIRYPIVIDAIFRYYCRFC